MSLKRRLRRGAKGKDEHERKSEVGKPDRRNNSKNADRKTQRVSASKNRM